MESLIPLIPLGFLLICIFVAHRRQRKFTSPHLHRSMLDEVYGDSWEWPRRRIGDDRRRA